MRGANFIEVENEGPLIAATNFWGSEYDDAGKYYCSVNAGAVRLLLPRAQRSLVTEVQAAQYVILSRGPWPAANVPEAVELLFEDGTDNPYVLHLTAASFDQLPAQPEPGREWVLSVWTLEDDRPHKAMELPCKWRRSRKLPDLSPLDLKA